MKLRHLFAGLVLSVAAALAQADSNRTSYAWMTKLHGDWALSPAAQQEGKATKHKVVAPLVGTDKVAMSFRVIGKGSTVQENLLPGTGKEMATMYHCNDFKACSQVRGTHYCAKQNQPAVVLEKNSGNQISFACDMNTALCQSNEEHVHNISHELSNSGKHLKTTYTIFKDGKFKKNSTYHFDRKS